MKELMRTLSKTSRCCVKQLLGVLLLFTSLLHAESLAEFDSQRLNVESLDGTWQFTTNTFASDEATLQDDHKTWQQMAVPGNWDTTEQYANYQGKAYYQRQFTVPKAWVKSNIRLKFSAVFQTSKVWLNGKYLGQHIGGYTPFEFIVTDKINFQSKNSIVVMADNSYHRGAWWPWGGISRSVKLFADNDLRIVHQHIDSVPDFENNLVHFNVKYQIQNYSGKSQSVRLTSKITNTTINNALVHEIDQQWQLSSEHYSTRKLSFILPLDKFKLWQLYEPNLYSLHSELSRNNAAITELSNRFGVRKFEIKGEQFYLNNQAVRLNGVNRVHDHPDFGNTEPKGLVLKDMQDIKALGANFSRIMHAPAAKSLLEVCDELGYLLIGEIPVWGDDDPQTFADNPLTKQWLREMIERDYNHPSIVGWSVGNELRDPTPPWTEKTLTQAQLNYVNTMLDHVEKLDPNRLKTYVSLTAFNKTVNKTNEPFNKVDFISINSYSNALNKVKQTHKNFPGKPIFLSEVGIKQIGSTAEASLADELVSELLQLRELQYLIGFSIWSYNDYRSGYKGTPASGYREWGIVDHYRNKKAAYYQFKDILQYWQK